MQFDADTVGAPTVAADAEMCMMMADVMEALGLKGQYVIRVNNRKVLDGALEAINLGGAENAGRRLTVLRAIDKLDKFRPEDVALLLGEGRWSDGPGQGDFTKGAGLAEDDIEFILEIFSPERLLRDVWTYVDDAPLRASIDMHTDEISRRPAFRDNLEALKLMRLQLASRDANTVGIDELEAIVGICESAGYGSRRIIVDAVVRGLEYYTGPVYEAELLAQIPNEDGQIVRFGSVGGGGRYDGLVSRFRGEPVPATGFSIGVSRLMTALKNLGKLDTSDIIAPVVVLVLDKDTESLGRYQKMVSELRAAKIRAELYLGGAGMKAQMKYADRRGAPCVVIQGGDERAKSEVQIKDLIEGARLSAEITDNAAWREGRPAQVTVPEGELVAAVQRVLAAQAEERGRAK
jgi:histidyl-tRNA synthetase